MIYIVCLWSEVLKAINFYFKLFKDGHMEQLKRLLIDLERVSFQDISEIPVERQHEVAEQIEQLQDNLSKLSQLWKNTFNVL